MLEQFSKAFIGFAFLFISGELLASYSPSKEITRYTFLYYNQFSEHPELLQSLKKQLPVDASEDTCLSEKITQNLLKKSDNPRSFLKLLTEKINRSCKKKRLSLSNINDQHSLYVLFSSEWGNNIESSMGHIRLALMKDQNFMFDQTYTFSASNFYAPETGTATLSNYLKAAFSSIDGKYSQSLFFDNYYETVLNESRHIHRFRVNIDEQSINDVYLELEKKTQKTSEYNFFQKNCSSEALSYIANLTNSPASIGSYQAPSQQLAALLDAGTITYVDTFSPTDKELKTHLNSDDIIYDNLSKVSVSSKEDILISAYDSPKHAYKPTYSNTQFLTFSFNHLDNEKSSLLILQKRSINSFRSGKPSFTTSLGYNINSNFFIGFSEIFEGIAISAMGGYSEIIGWSLNNRLDISLNNIDAQITYTFNDKDESFEARINSHLSSRFSLSISGNESALTMWANYRF